MPLTIVVADDNEGYRDIVRHVLARGRRRHDHRGRGGRRRGGARARATPLADFMITDLIMRRLNGIELTKIILQ